MNARLKSTLKYTGVFFFGLLFGAFLLETLEIYLRPSYRDLIIRSHLKTEQEFLASRAVRENRSLDAVYHRWAVVNAESEEGFCVFRDPNKELEDSPYLYPLNMIVLKSMASGTNIEKGKKIVEGIDRGKLAIALDALGRKKEAEEQWQLAQQLTHHATMKATRDFVYKLLEQEKTDIHLKTEDKVLGPQKH
ncbi:MAG TPA: hypothetical protein VN604_08130 [Nitrospirota bacterium]|nr:hypothetical protein [Nitrospirota bacterium]